MCYLSVHQWGICSTVCEATGLMEGLTGRVWGRWLFQERSRSVSMLLLERHTVPVHLSDGCAPGATEMAREERPGVGRAALRTNSSGPITKGPGAAQILTAPIAISSPPWPRRRVLGASRCWPGVTARPVPGVPGSCLKQVVSTEGVYVLWCFLNSTISSDFDLTNDDHINYWEKE